MQQLRDYVFSLLETKLPLHLCYHNPAHTGYVLQDAENLAAQEGLPAQQLELLQVAAILHDTGYLHTVKGHEEMSCRIAQDLLPGYGYSTEEITAICSIIMATQVPQAPHNHAAQILCDADLYYLGTAQYTAVAEKLYRELQALGLVQDHDAWARMQVEFLSTHQYFTNTARQLLEPTKRENLANLTTKISITKHGNS